MAWHNADGLYIKMGPDEATPGKAGTVYGGGNRHIAEVEFDLSLLATASSLILDDNVVIPKNARIEAVEVITITAADSASDTAVLNVGLIGTDRSTAIDLDGLVLSAAQTTIDLAGEKTILTTGGDAGALLGTTLAANGLLVADADTEVFTAGRVRIRVVYFFL